MNPTAPEIQQLTDQEQIRHLIDAYAHNADRRNPAAQAALFTEDGRVTVYGGDPAVNEPAQIVTGRAELEAAFSGLNAYAATTHFNGQSTITVSGDTATGETYCLAHHLHDVDGVRTLMVMSIRYDESIVRVEGQWLFAERKLIIDWTDSRPSAG
ncbi:nuclear transport factor 2 family protein [Leifsonia sp. NPDC058230]|uniref:nuclear transport factor 2 family protein n=1 Tax=Leifsonia sp. NPDC058230 TaxID=3346391 RepID=UPI0036DA124A